MDMALEQMRKSGPNLSAYQFGIRPDEALRYPISIRIGEPEPSRVELKHSDNKRIHGFGSLMTWDEEQHGRPFVFLESETLMSFGAVGFIGGANLEFGDGKIKCAVGYTTDGSATLMFTNAIEQGKPTAFRHFLITAIGH